VLVEEAVYFFKTLIFVRQEISRSGLERNHVLGLKPSLVHKQRLSALLDVDLALTSAVDEN
jgi:hypothetical protein